jgi:hypothetical protein
MIGRWSIVRDRAAYDRAWKLARGCYQRALLAGSENLSGSTLTGVAASYGPRYADSRRNLIARIRAAGIPIGEIRGPSPGRARILTIG